VNSGEDGVDGEGRGWAVVPGGSGGQDADDDVLEAPVVVAPWDHDGALAAVVASLHRGDGLEPHAAQGFG
jgi:hypothetical protein